MSGRMIQTNSCLDVCCTTSAEGLHHLASGRISRCFNRLFQRVNHISSVLATQSLKAHCFSSRISVSRQHNFGEFRRSVSTGFQSGNYSANERGGSGGSPSARTRRARCRTQVLHSSSSHLMTRQVVTVLTQVGLRPQVVAEGLLTVTWPTETNLDLLERQEPLSMEMHIYRDQGMKFRRLSGPESLFRWKLQKVLSLVYAQCGW
ncbi:conserved hypothetical protein [Echinococcus multilocularis]|uniref:Uncharacterized protein n=1 Tax=Echinococcus multilocularis TaxID=6211 RepID=A0A068Y527_ECHMU|nr:conserved hypothetical protein [Echinococcus multilocularis]